jgi:hypothetical protein
MFERSPVQTAQLASVLDQARGLPQSYLTSLLAIGEQAELVREVERARTLPPGVNEMIYSDRTGTWTQLRLEALFRRAPRGERARWSAWRAKAAATVDPVWVSNDIAPGIFDLLQRLWYLGRHPRAFLRTNTQKAF